MGVTLKGENFSQLEALSLQLRKAQTDEEKFIALAGLLPVFEQYTLLQQPEAALPNVFLRNALVTMDCSTPSSIMRYKVNGERPSEKSQLYKRSGLSKRAQR